MKFATISKSVVMGLALLLASSAFAATKASLNLQHPTTVNGTKLKAGDYKLGVGRQRSERRSQHHPGQKRVDQSAGESRRPELPLAEQRSRLNAKRRWHQHSLRCSLRRQEVCSRAR